MKCICAVMYFTFCLLFYSCAKKTNQEVYHADPIEIANFKKEIDINLSDKDYKKYINNQLALAEIYKKSDSLGVWLYCYDRIIKVSRDNISLDTAIFFYKYVNDNIWRNPNDSASIENLAWIHRQIAFELGPKLHQWAKCIPYYQQGIDLIDEGNSWTSDKAIKFLKPCGSAFTRLGEPQKAISYLKRSYEICRINNDTLSMLKSLNDLGIAYSDVTNYHEAFTTFRNALKINSLNNFPEEKIETISHMITLFLSEKQADSVVIYLNQFKKIIDSYETEKDDIGDYYDKMAGLKVLENDFKDAEQNYKISIQYFLQSDESRNREAAKVCIELGNCYKNAMKFQEALNAFQQALVLSITNYNEEDVTQSLPEHFYYPENVIMEASLGKAETYFSKYQIESQPKDLSFAIVFYKDAIRASEVILDSYELESSKIKFKEKTAEIHEKLNTAIILLNQ